jgi:hypothetical protein
MSFARVHNVDIVNVLERRGHMAQPCNAMDMQCHQSGQSLFACGTVRTDHEGGSGIIAARIVLWA